MRTGLWFGSAPQQADPITCGDGTGMDSTALLAVVGVAVVVLFILLTGLCLNCKGINQPTHIRQQQVYDPRNSYAPNQGFTVVRPYTEPPSYTVQSSQQRFIKSPSMADARQVSACPSSDDGGSQSDYINQNVDDAVSYELPPEKTPDYPDYLDVLPDVQNVPQQNLGSSLNSGQNCRNLKKRNNEDDEDDDDDDSDSQHYINVNEEVCVGSLESHSSDDQGSSDYVNAPIRSSPKHISFHLG